MKTSITAQTIGQDLYDAAYLVRNAAMAARPADGAPYHAGDVTVDALRAAFVVAYAQTTLARWSARRPALEAAIRKAGRRAATVSARSRVDAGNAALAALAAEREAAERRAVRVAVDAAADRETIAAALDELAAGANGPRAAERYRKAAGYIRAGARWAELAGGALAVSRGISDHELEAGRPCSCKAGQNGLACWAGAVAEAIGLVRRRAEVGAAELRRVA
jgi:hypothetical protein